MANSCRKFPTLYRLGCADFAAHVGTLIAIGDPQFQAKRGAAGVRTGDIFSVDGCRKFPTLYRLR